MLSIICCVLQVATDIAASGIRGLFIGVPSLRHLSSSGCCPLSVQFGKPYWQQYCCRFSSWDYWNSQATPLWQGGDTVGGELTHDFSKLEIPGRACNVTTPFPPG